MSKAKTILPKLILPLLFMAIAAMAYGLYGVFKQSLWIKNRVLEDVRVEFISYATTVNASQKLQVAEMTQFESFERKSSAQFLNIDLPDVVVAISAPVTYTYTVDFKEDWQFKLDGEYLDVTPPPLRFNTPAADLSETKFVIKEGSLLRNEASVLKALQKDIGPLLQERGESNKTLVLAVAQSSIEDFVKKWLSLKDPKGKDAKVRIIWPASNSENPH